MSLSVQERRAVRALEHQLVASDPEFASRISHLAECLGYDRAGARRGYFLRHRRWTLLMLVLALVVAVILPLAGVAATVLVSVAVVTVFAAAGLRQGWRQRAGLLLTVRPPTWRR